MTFPIGWVAHEVYGGTNTAKKASSHERAWAQNMYEKITHIYGRVDGIPAEDGTLRLRECERVVPRLFLKEGNAIDKYADEILRVLKSRRTF